MVKEHTSALALKLIDIPGKLLNYFMYFLFIGAIPVSIQLAVKKDIFTTKFVFLMIGLFCFATVLNGLIQNFTFDKHFKELIFNKQELVLNNTLLPTRWFINQGMLRAIIYGAAIFMIMINKKSLSSMVNYFATSEEFIIKVRLKNKSAVLLICLSGILMLISIIIQALLYKV